MRGKQERSSLVAFLNTEIWFGHYYLAIFVLISRHILILILGRRCSRNNGNNFPKIGQSTHPHLWQTNGGQLFIGNFLGSIVQGSQNCCQAFKFRKNFSHNFIGSLDRCPSPHNSSLSNQYFVGQGMQANDEIPPSETMWAVQQITNQIVYRVANRIRTSPLDHKLFGFRVQSKFDIDRNMRERNFVNSLTIKECEYSEPPMPARREISPSKEDAVQMTQQAQDFIKSIQQQKKQSDGRFYLLKRAEYQKAREKDKSTKINNALQKETQKSIRRLKAERNIQFFNQKRQAILQKQEKSRISKISQSGKFYSNLSSQENYEFGTVRERLPTDLYQIELEQIRQEGAESVPQGVQKSTVRQYRKRAATQAYDRVETTNTRYFKGQQDDDDQLGEQQIVLSLDKKKPSTNQARTDLSFNLISMDDLNNSKGQASLRSSSISKLTKRNRNLQPIDPSQKKYYHMRRNTTEDYSEQIQKYINIRQSQGWEGREEQSISSSISPNHRRNQSNKQQESTIVKLPAIKLGLSPERRQRFRTVSHIDS